jgi:ADP-heptose:LPS heptosyltransferase
LHGPTDAVMTGPYGRLDTVVQLDIPCRPCFSRTCSHRSCLEWLEVEPVLEAAKEQIDMAPRQRVKA